MNRDLRDLVPLVVLVVSFVGVDRTASAKEALRSRAEAETASLELVDSLRSMEDAVVTRSGAEATQGAQVEIQITIAQLEDLARLFREGASAQLIAERFRALEVQRRRLAGLSAARGDVTLPKEIVTAAADRWAALAAFVRTPR